MLLGTQDTAGNRIVRPGVAQAILPAVGLGFAIPSILMLMPFDPITKQNIIALWQPFPIYCYSLVKVFTAAIQRVKSLELSQKTIEKSAGDDKCSKLDKSATKETLAEEFARMGKDSNSLKQAYVTTFAVSAATHICSVVYIALRPDLTLSKVFLNLPYVFHGPWPLAGKPLMSCLGYFKYDFGLLAAANACYSLYNVWDMRRRGYTTSKDAVKAAVATIAGQFLVGPGATMAGVWYWRQNVLMGMSSLKS